MLNQVMMIGNLGADPEVKSFQSGGRVCNMRLAVTEKWKDRDGNRQERTEWVPITIYGDGLVGVCEKYLRKGSKIFVQGKWRTRKWTDQSGQDRYSTEVIADDMKMLDSAGDGRGERKQSYRDEPDGSQGHAQQSYADDLSDDIPFIRGDGIW